MNRRVARCSGYGCPHFTSANGLYMDRKGIVRESVESTTVRVFQCCLTAGLGGRLMPVRAKQFERHDVPEACPFLTEYAVSQCD